MNEKAIKDIVEGVVRTLVAGLGDSSLSAPLRAPVVMPVADAVPVELSARHAHLSEKDALTLFGGPLTPARELSQPGQFLCKERVRLIGPKGVMDNVAVLGPSRGKTQIELSKTDARSLGIDAPVRQSGDTAGTPGIILASLTGVVGLEEGVIVASRHIHIPPEDAVRFGVADSDMVSVRLESERPVVLEDVLVRVHETFRLSMHIDPDEGNSSGWTTGVSGRIVGRKSGSGHGRHGR